MTIVETELKETELKPGDTFTRHGYSVTVHCVKDGVVYFDKHRVEESGEPFGSGRNGWGQLSRGEFIEGVAGAARTVEAVATLEKDSDADIQLKVWTQFFYALSTGAKNFEVRLNDRTYTEGTILHLCEYDQHSRVYTGRSCLRRVTYVLYGGQFGVEDGYVVMGLEPVAE